MGGAGLLALVVDADGMQRQEVTGLLQRQGVQVETCETVEQGRTVFQDHALVLAPVNGDNAAVMDFVHWLRTRSGRSQPYVVGVGDCVAPASEWHGFNEFLLPPVSDHQLHLSLEAARRWHGWTVDLLGTKSATSEASRRVTAGNTADWRVETDGAALPHGLSAVFQETEGPRPVVSSPVEPDDPAFWDIRGAFAAETIPGVESDEDPMAGFQDLCSEDTAAATSPDKTPPAPPTAPVQATVAADAIPAQTPEEAALNFREILEAAPYGMLVLDEDAEVVYANARHRTITGRSVEECGGLQSWLEAGCAVEVEQRRRTIEEWWERVWKQRFTFSLTMRSGEGILKEIEFRPAPLGSSRLVLTVFDITDNRREEEALRASEARYRSICQQSAAGMVLLNASGNVADANLTFERLAACSRLDVRRIGLQQFFPPEDHEKIAAAAASLARGETVDPLATCLLPRRGGSVPVALGLSTIKNTPGATVFTAYHLQPLPKDFSFCYAPSTPSSPSAMPVSRRLVELVPDLLLEVDASGTVLDHTQSRDFPDLTPDSADLRGQPFEQAFPTLAATLPLEEILNQLQLHPEEEVRCEVSLPRDGGTGEHQHCEVRGIWSRKRGTATGTCTLIVRDVTRLTKKKSADAQEPVGGFGFSALRLLRQAAIVTNDKGRIVDMNPRAEEMFGYTCEELTGHGLYKLFLPDQPKEFAARISDHIKQHRCWIGRSSYFRKDGTKRRLSIELVPYEEGEKRGFLGLMRDITDEERPVAKPAVAAPADSITLHRARNDLQVLASVLSMQAADRGMGEDARRAVQQSKDRVAAVALIYRLVDGASGLVPFHSYARELAEQLRRSHRIADDRVQIRLTGASVALPQKLALSAGILLREIIDETLATHFGENTRGTLTIHLNTENGEAVIRIKDDALLQTEDAEAVKKQSLSWQIVESLAEQLRADIRLLHDLENETRIRFRLNADAVGD